MHDNYNYPLGADNPDAPWNQVDPPDVDFNVEAIVNLSRTAKVTTDCVYKDDDDIRICEDYGAKGAYYADYASIPEMLDELVKYIDGEMLGNISNNRKEELMRLKASATDWQIDDEEYNSY